MPELISARSQPCDCQSRLKAFAEGKGWWYGTQVRCDCGRLYQLAEDQREKRDYWALAVADPRD